MRTRNPKHGFSLLETMLATAILSLVLGATYTLVGRTLNAQAVASQTYQMTSLARAILDEYTVTYPDLDRVGTYRNHWKWQIEEQKHAPLAATEFDRFFEFVEISVSIVPLNSRSQTPVELSTVIARRAKR